MGQLIHRGGQLIHRARLALLLALSLAPVASGQKLKTGEPHPRTAVVATTSSDGVRVVGDLYLAHAEPQTPFIVLLHDGALNRGEYHSIAVRLNTLGFNCLAPDLRAGKNAFGEKNRTRINARNARRRSSILDAELDVIAALSFARERYAEGQLIAMGCSYSASLALRLAGTHPELVDGVIALSPAEHFVSQGAQPDFVQTSAASGSCPVLILSKKVERPEWQAIFDALASDRKRAFSPEGAGVHGARALWDNSAFSGEYWAALTEFLEEFFPRPPAEADVAGETEDETEGGSVLERMVVIGSSVSMGFGLTTTMAELLESSIEVKHTPVEYMWSGFFFMQPLVHGAEQVAFAARAEPTLVVGIDYLFWLGYGVQNGAGERLEHDEERLDLLERGLAFLDTLDCPLVVGDFPDMQDAIGKMLAAEQVPLPSTRVLLNERLAEWARERGDVIVLPLARIIADMRAGEPFTIGRAHWPVSSVSRVLQFDRLHPTLEGQAALAHAVASALVERGLARPEELKLDLAEVLDEYDVTFVSVPVASGAAEAGAGG